MRRTLEDFTPGETIVTPGVTVTAGMIVDFALSYDPQPIHLDIPAAEAGPYGVLIASGFQTLALGFRMLVQSGVFASGLGSPGMENVRWPRPLTPGDTIHAVATVTSVRPSQSKPDRGILALHVEMLNQRGEIVCSADGTFFIRRRE